MNAINEAERLLATIAQFSAQQALDQAEFDAEMKALKERYSIIGSRAESIKVHETMLVRLMKKNKGVFFPEGTDQVTLENGVLLHGHGTHVVIPRDALQAIKDAGYAAEAIKKVESVDRAVVDKWPDEKLFMIGARREPEEKFEYELKDKPQAQEKRPAA